MFKKFSMLILVCFILLQSCHSPDPVENVSTGKVNQEIVLSLLAYEFHAFENDSFVFEKKYIIKHKRIMNDSQKIFRYNFLNYEEVLKYSSLKGVFVLDSFLLENSNREIDKLSAHLLFSKNIIIDSHKVLINKYIVDIESIDGHSFLFSSSNKGIIARYYPMSRTLIMLHSLDSSFLQFPREAIYLDSSLIFNDGIPPLPPDSREE